jgi:hypothetical protein
MIIQLDAATTADTTVAQRTLGDLARQWGHQISHAPSRPHQPPADLTR